MKGRDILRDKASRLVTISEPETLLAASKRLAEHNIGVLLVTNEKERPVGILSERDIVRVFAQHGCECAEMSVREAMTPDPIIGLPDDDLTAVATTMTKNRIRHLPILDGSQMVGLVSIRDVVEAQLNESEGEIRRLQAYMNSIP